MARPDPILRTFLAFGGACLVPGIFFGVVWPLSGVHDAPSILGSAIVMAMWSGTAVLGIGGPLYFLCKCLGVLSWWTALLGGLLGGITIWAVLPNDRPLELALLGAATGITFWVLYRLLHRPLEAKRDEG